MKVDLILKKKSCKRNLIKLIDSNSGKIVFALSTEIITLYVRSIIIDFRKFSFEEFFSTSFFGA